MQTILLAAGLGQRSGGQKLLFSYQGKPIIYHSLAASLNAGIPTVLVTGYRSKEIVEAVAPLHSELLTVVHNSFYKSGQGSSIKAGAAALPARAPFGIALGDMPLLQPEHYLHLWSAFNDGVLRPQVQGQVGHPVLLAASFIEVITKTEGAFRMQDLLASYPLFFYESSDEAYIRDVDTASDYQRLIDS